MVTSHDVARDAGVSQPTVSRALRGLPGIAPSTVAHVRAVADRLGYVPSEAGRTLSTRRTRRVGIVTAELTNPFYPELIEPIRAELEANGYRTLLVPDDMERREADRLYGSLDGVILTTAHLDSTLPAHLQNRSIPFVLVNRVVEDLDADSCSFDSDQGATAIADLLVEQGHADIAMISGPESTSTGRDRSRAFGDALRDRGAQLQDRFVRRAPFSFDAGRRSMIEILGEGAPSAVFCANDVLAIGACDALAAAGMSWNSDVTVVGFDDIPMASWSTYGLTTVRCDRALMARESVAMLLNRIENPSTPHRRLTLPTELVVRGGRDNARIALTTVGGGDAARR